MEKIKLLVFIDDDYATNFYHKIIVRDSGLVDNYLFFATAKIYIMLTTSLNPDDQEKAELNPLVRGLKNKPLTEAHLKELQKDLTLIV